MVSLGLIFAVGIVLVFFLLGGKERLSPALEQFKQDTANIRQSITQRAKDIELKSAGLPEGEVGKGTMSKHLKEGLR